MLGFLFFLAQLIQWDVSADSYKAWFPRLAKTSKTKVKITVRMSTVLITHYLHLFMIFFKEKKIKIFIIKSTNYCDFC